MSWGCCRRAACTPSGSHRRAGPRALPRRASRSSSMPSSTAATRRRKARAASWRSSETAIAGCTACGIATVSGRYYAMDRDKRWDRVAKAYAAHRRGRRRARFDDAVAAIDESYAQDVTDEFVLPAVIGDYAGMADGDALLFANFRADRAREISLAPARSRLRRLRAQPRREILRRRGPDGIFRRTRRL